VAHLCHQANQAREASKWRDSLPRDRKIVLKTAHQYGEGWVAYKSLKPLIDSIGDEAYRDASHDFRHKYNHRFPPGVVLGMTQMIRRDVDPKTKKASYTFGGIDPINLEAIIELLADQSKRGYAAFAAFQDLIREHETSIANVRSSTPAPVACSRARI
jgi:hypothetical protein